MVMKFLISVEYLLVRFNAFWLKTSTFSSLLFNTPSFFDELS